MLVTPDSMRNTNISSEPDGCELNWGPIRWPGALAPCTTDLGPHSQEAAAVFCPTVAFRSAVAQTIQVIIKC